MIRDARPDDLQALVQLEQAAFATDRLSRRSFRHLLRRGHAIIRVAESPDGALCGYVIVLLRQGTSLARLYSIAVAPAARGTGQARALVADAERAARGAGCAVMRLEIRRDNAASLGLFEGLGYRRFGRYPMYYADAMDALRLEKYLPARPAPALARAPYYAQTLDFTCGSAALMMAMRALDPALTLDRRLELRLWREATTVFMTSGLGGCGPEGLALAAHRRGFAVTLQVNTAGPLLLDSVRSPEKRAVMRLVHEDFTEQLAEAGIHARHESVGADGLERLLAAGAVPVVLISLYRIHRERSPHWVTVTGVDDDCVYVHDPWVHEAAGRTATDCMNLPILRADFDRMARYGRTGQRAVVTLHPIGESPGASP